MVQKFLKRVFLFIIFFIKCVFLTIGNIAIFAIISEIINYSKDMQINFFLHIYERLCNFWIEEFNFHFSYITSFFIFFTCGFIKRYLRLNKMLFMKFFLVLVFLSYIGVNFWIYNNLEFYYNTKNEIFCHDLLISSVVILFAISITLFYNIDIDSINIKNTNKKIIEKYLPIDKVPCLVFIFNFYFSQYTSCIFFNGKIFLQCVIVLALFLVLLVYKFIVYRLTLSYLGKVAEKENNVYYVVNSDAYVEAELWKAFQKPIIFKSSQVLLNGIVLINNQCLAINQQKEHMIIGIDCYSRFLQEQERILINKNLFCYIIKEAPLFNSLDDDFEISRNYKKGLHVHRIHNISNGSLNLSFFDSINNDALYVVKARQLLIKYNINETITRIFNFDNYLFSITNVFENSSDKFVIFNTILKGCEAIIHYQVVYFLINEHIEINQELVYTNKNGEKAERVDKFVESGSLGSWVDLAQKVLKSKNKYEASWYSKKINTNDSIWNAISKQQYPNISKSASATTNYGLISERIINIRNNTIGHGSSEYVPDNDQLIYLFEIYLYLLKETELNFHKLIHIEKQIWMLESKENVKFLDIFIQKENTLRYIDYLNESFSFAIYERKEKF